MSKLSRWVKKQTAHGLSLNGLKSSVKGAAKNPLTYAAASLLIPGVAPMALNALKGAGGLAVKGIGALAHGAGAAAKGVGSALLPQAVSSFLPHGADGSLDVGGLFDKGLGAAQVVNAANLQKQSTGYAHNAMDIANQSYDARAPLRVAGIEGLLRPQTADLSSLSQIPGNPFAVKPKPAAMPIPVSPAQRPTGPDVVYGN